MTELLLFKKMSLIKFLTKYFNLNVVKLLIKSIAIKNV